MNKELLLQGFYETYNSDQGLELFFAPGRVNIIGEHIDYNGGHVFPCALSVGTYLVCKDRTDKKLRLFSHNCIKAGVFEINIDEISYKTENGWANYPLGVFKTLMEASYKIEHGFDIYYYGNISGSGLSSSASIEVVTAFMLNSKFNLGISIPKLAQYCQKSENKFNGLSCGIMDQFACAMGRREHAMFLDTATLTNKYVKMELDPYQIVVINSKVPHSLTSSHYNDRLKECREALKCLQFVKPTLKHLCELSVEEFNKISTCIEDPILLSRAKFAIEEEDRVHKAIAALNKNDIMTFGSLLTASGEGLKVDYDATCPQVDTLVSTCLSFDDCIGSRETGGGWGGNIIALVKKDKIDQFKEYVKKEYLNKTGLLASFLVLYIGAGVHKVKW